MDDATSAKILEKYLQDRTIDSIYDYAVGVPTGDAPEVPRGKDILMSDLETFRQVEGSRAVYEDMMSAMRQTSSKWYGMAASQEENPEYGFYSKAIHQLKNTRLRFDNALQNGDASMFGADTALGTDLRNQLGLMEENYFAATRAHMSRSGDNAFEALRSSVAGTGDEFDKQLAKLENWSKSVEKLEQQLLAFKKAREEMTADSDTDAKADLKAIEAQETRIEEAKRLVAKGRVDLLKDNNESFAAKFESLSESMTGKTASPQEKIRRAVEQYKKQIVKYQEQLDEAFGKNLLTEEDYGALKTQ